MNEILRITILCENEKGNFYEHVDHCESMINISRILLTFKAKRGYKPVKYEIEETGVLV